MNRNDNMDRDERLSTVLQTWKVNEPLPPRFAQDVWRRIAHTAPSNAGIMSWLAPLIRWWDLAVRRPVFAVAYLGLFLAAGLSVGFWQAQEYAHSTERTWQTTYVQSVTPTAAFRP